jgi:hypothetical protein
MEQEVNYQSNFLTNRERIDRLADRIEKQYNSKISFEHRQMLENKIDELEGII